jgi:hypothetical protein
LETGHGSSVASSVEDAIRGVDAVLIVTSTPIHADLIELLWRALPYIDEIQVADGRRARPASPAWAR